MNRIIQFSIQNKVIISAFVLAWIAWGIHSLSRLPLDAIPDVTNNQVNIVTSTPNLAPVEMEQFVTYPIELAMANIQGLENIRSVSQFGLSIVTLDFKDVIEPYWARNQVSERLTQVREDIPKGFGVPQLLPLTTGLGEIFQYSIEPIDPKDTTFSLIELRTIQDWVVKKQLLGTEGVAEVSSFGGHLKQYQVRVNPLLLKSNGITLDEVFRAVEAGNANTGAAYIEKNNNLYFIRGVGLATNIDDLNNIFIKSNGANPIAIKDIATIEEGSAIRFGTMVQNDHETAGGIVLMLKGENSRKTILNIKKRLENIQKSLPKGLKIVAFLDREELIDRTIHTVSINLLEGGFIVVFVLVLLLGHWRAGLIVASVIPLSMLFAISMMVLFNVSGNLMSLGAIDFGLIIDGAVIIVENIISKLSQKIDNQLDTNENSLLETNDLTSSVPTESTTGFLSNLEYRIFQAAVEIRQSAMFGEIIIMIVYIPLLLLTGIEGKMFKPMALTVIFSLIGAFILSLTYIPMMSALFLKAAGHSGENVADKLLHKLYNIYEPVLRFALRFKKIILSITIIATIFTFWLYQNIGGEFIPELDEGDFVIEIRMMPGTSLPQMIETGKSVGTMLRREFPNEILLTNGKMGASEVPTDPMSIEEMDLVLKMKDRKDWKRCKSRADFEAQLGKILAKVPGIFTSIQQPIAMRFNELMTGAKTDIIVKVFGSDLEKLAEIGEKVEKTIHGTEGAKDISLVKAEGMPQLFVTYRRDALLRYGMTIESVNNMLQMAIAGKKAGVMYEGNRRFDITVRLNSPETQKPADISELLITNAQGVQIPLRYLADIKIQTSPMAVNRENNERCVNVNLNVRGRDVQSVVEEVREKISKKVKLPQNYHISYGGQFENLENAKARLQVVVPAALLLILLLLYLTFNDLKQSLLIFTAIPLSAIGGVWALVLRGMPFSISAGVGFIALFGVAVLNGMVLIARFNQLKSTIPDHTKRILQGVYDRFRPVIMTATVASLGFIPMALATGAGAEVQKPLATVVIGGLITATLLTLIILPILYSFFADKKK
jgi:cobalt-zinc-cadmium resistance protein CzcA